MKPISGVDGDIRLPHLGKIHLPEGAGLVDCRYWQLLSMLVHYIRADPWILKIAMTRCKVTAIKHVHSKIEENHHNDFRVRHQTNIRMAPCHKSGNQCLAEKRQGKKPKAKGGRLIVGEMSIRASRTHMARPGSLPIAFPTSVRSVQSTKVRYHKHKGQKNTKRRNFARGPRIANGELGNPEATPPLMLFLGYRGGRG